MAHILLTELALLAGYALAITLARVNASHYLESFGKRTREATTYPG